jgi:hypothetical protein
MNDTNALTRTNEQDTWRHPQTFTLNAKKVEIETERQTLLVEKSPLGVIIRANGVSKVLPEPIADFPPFTLISSVSSPDNYATIPSFARITVNLDLVQTIQKMFIMTVENGLDDVRMRRYPDWSDEFTSVENQMCVSHFSHWWFQAEEKHSNVPVSSYYVDFTDLMAMIEAARLGKTRAFSDSEAESSWQQKYAYTDGDDELFAADFGEHQPESGYYDSLDAAGNPPANRIWSIIESENEVLFAAAGAHVINVIGYIVTAYPWKHERQTYLWSPGVDGDGDDEETESPNESEEEQD